MLKIAKLNGAEMDFIGTSFYHDIDVNINMIIIFIIVILAPLNDMQAKWNSQRFTGF